MFVYVYVHGGEWLGVLNSFIKKYRRNKEMLTIKMVNYIV